jgi:glycosyltransferase involved in cell wall biosynthesis
VLLIHGVHSPFLWFGVLARRLLGVRTVVVLTDPPGVVLQTDGTVARVLKSVDIRLVRLALRNVDGVLALTAPLAVDYAPDVPHLVLEGILEAETAVAPPAARPSTDDVTLLYAGGLSVSYGVDRLVEAVEGLAGPVRLRTYGKGPLAEWIDSRANGRIEPPTFVTRGEVRAAYGEVDLLVQPRPVDQHFVRYSFPSKLLEYLSSGTPVVTTRLPGIPADYDGHVYWIDDDSVDGVRAGIAAALAASPTERAEKGRAAAEFVRATRSAAAQGRRIREFLASLR